MKTKISTLTIIMAVALLVPNLTKAQNAKQWMVDKAHTSVNFDISHFFSTVNGSFNEFDGTFYFDPNNLDESKFTFTIPVKSIYTNNEKRDNHLKSEDFFNSSKYPNIKFESTGFEKKSGKNYVVKGKLTIKETTKNISVPFEYKGEMDHPMMKGTKILGLQFKTDIDRSNYNVGVGDWASDMVVGDTAEVTINMELNRKE
ncbi:YceI family protein [Gramella sp. AN32]|uniref:YceI family protein n=1 Tax=Christiangramia antarctica TaxID=2058158 RepID=A0ABW5X2Z9_9FLAO|nr:YceI family protein [Gramella sp. AN32]MCM4157973.1 polyisoprenoid-binding protein [Gramella sp. AN32]